ncbi:MAG: hypothetical protein CL587_09840 [Alteromonadaceae bacterium]|nr:hypothetical protein [Alteromonadaceae bacterium]
MPVVRITGIAIAVAMMSLLIFMTFHKSYYLSLSLPAVSWPDNKERGVDTLLNSPAFKDSLEKLKAHELDLFLSTLLENEKARQIDQLSQKEKKALFLSELPSHLLLQFEGNNLVLELRSIKHAKWSDFLVAVSSGFFVFDVKPEARELKEKFIWSTDYVLLVEVLLTAFAITLLIGALLLWLKGRAS